MSVDERKGFLIDSYLDIRVNLHRCYLQFGRQMIQFGWIELIYGLPFIDELYLQSCE